MTKRILVTAFEPFAGRKLNPALEVMAKLKPAAFKGCRLYREKLPVSGRAVGGRIAALISKIKPDYLISLGLAAGETGLRVERFALNMQDYGIKDNAGYRPQGKKIAGGGPAAYFVNADPLKLVAAARKAGVPAYASNHAGAYVCNHLMYEAMRAIAAAGQKTRFAFIHLPLTTEMALLEKPGRGVPPSLPLALLVKAVEAAIKAIR
ncbi:MAG: pyroglutamyl-peptidase I [Elusimicrobiota bacterium]|nr:pyroglutamyl-peptidase I [Elusimicrobiota bacterium]